MQKISSSIIGTMSRAVLQVKKLSEKAILPVRGSPLAAGFDLSSAEDVVVPARGKALVKTDLAIAIPSGCYGRVAPRSGLAWKKHIDVGADVIDEDYRGNVGVVLFNHAQEDFEIKHGDRIAQLILERIEHADIHEVEDLSETARGAGGFGSTGVSGVANDGPVRAVRVVTPTSKSELLPDLLEELNVLLKENVINENQKLAMKKLLFAHDERIMAALAVKRRTGNVAEFMENLDLILNE